MTAEYEKQEIEKIKIQFHSQSLIAKELFSALEEQFASSGQSVSFQANINPYSTFMPSAGKVRIDIEGYTKNFQSQTTNFMRQIRMVVSSPAVQVTNVGNQAFINPNDPDTLIVVNK